MTTGDGRIVSYHCQLCECYFNDPAARLLHLKGRRHLLAYKVVHIVVVVVVVSWWRGVVGSAFRLKRSYSTPGRLVLRSVTACGQVNHLGAKPAS